MTTSSTGSFHQNEMCIRDSLCDVGCIVLAEGISLDDAARAKAVQQHITVLSTDMPIFDAALKVHERIHA